MSYVTSAGVRKVVFTPRKPSVELEAKVYCTEPTNNMQVFLQEAVKEVKQQPFHIQKKYKKLAKKAIIASLCILGTAIALEPSLLPSVMAATQETVPVMIESIPVNGEEFEVIPPELFNILKQLIIGAMKFSVGFAVLLLLIAGFYRMIGLEEKAVRWTTNILKGFGQIWIAVPVILLIYLVVTFMFGGLGSGVFNKLF